VSYLGRMKDKKPTKKDGLKKTTQPKIQDNAFVSERCLSSDGGFVTLGWRARFSS